MGRFIKTFVGNGTVEVADKANKFAKENKLEIVSAQLSFSAAGHICEAPVLVVVYESEKPKRARKKSDGKEDGADE